MTHAQFTTYWQIQTVWKANIMGRQMNRKVSTAAVNKNQIPPTTFPQVFFACFFHQFSTFAINNIPNLLCLPKCEAKKRSATSTKPIHKYLRKTNEINKLKEHIQICSKRKFEI